MNFCNWNRYQKGRHSFGPSQTATFCIFFLRSISPRTATNHLLVLIIYYNSIVSFFMTVEHFACGNVRSHHRRYSASIQGSSKRWPPHECQPIRKSRRFSSTWRPTSRSWTSIQPFLPRGWSVREHRSVTFRFSLPLFGCMINMLAPGKDHSARESATNTVALLLTIIY